MDLFGFYTGREFSAYEYLGAHLAPEGGVVFRTFAPAAARVTVIGDFNTWQDWEMRRVQDGNFWELTVPQAKAGERYKYRITGQDGRTIDHCDPYGFQMELRPQSASLVCPLESYAFQDEAWMASRSVGQDKPVNIYELHFGSWRKKSAEPEGWYSYRELGDILIPYLRSHGYNYIELMPLAEHPSDASWGYQTTGFFSPTSRYGTPDDLRFFIDQCHNAGIGVLLDFVPVHFAVDDYALWNYDGTALYEYPHTDVGRSEWGSCNFMHSRGEVRSFLQSAAWYWLREFHMDGLRFDAVSNLIYWQGDQARGVNGAAVQFLQTMTSELKERAPQAILVAEDSSAYPGVTRSVSEGGLGFDYKWCLGWMHDTLEYFQSAPEYRSRDYHKLTFSMMYFPGERYLLPLSHDEVVHGKATVVQKMNGDYDGKFPQARALYLYMMAHPGKKLNFMGGEFGQLREWDESREQDWDVLKYPNHDAFLRYITDLNRLYLTHPALSQWDYCAEGFGWLDCHQEGRCIYALERRGEGERLVFLLNLSGQRQSYQLQVEGVGRLIPLLNTDWQTYGGSTVEDAGAIPRGVEGFSFDLVPFSGLCLLAEK